MPGNQPGYLPRTYVLPGESLDVRLASPIDAGTDQVRLAPATVYGYAVDDFHAPVLRGDQ